jgi:hypothetical protein
LRHVSWRRTHRDPADAIVDLRAAIADWDARLGPSTLRKGEVPETLAPGGRLRPVVVEWAYADLLVRITTIDFGKGGVSVDERIEVPWGIRSDAPSVGPPPPRS